MNTYDFSPATRNWLSQLIGDHFNGRPAAMQGFERPTRPDKHLHLVLDCPTILPVSQGARTVQLAITAGSRLVAFRPADAKYGILAAIFDSDGSQYTFIGHKDRLVFWPAAYLNGCRQGLSAA